MTTTHDDGCVRVRLVDVLRFVGSDDDLDDRLY
jgi:hypothetical protein